MQDSERQIDHNIPESKSDESAFIEKVKQEFPEVQWNSHKFITHGWDHNVLRIDDKVIFRAPKDDRYADKMKDEIGLLGYLKGRVEVGLPDYKYIAKDQSVAGYEMLKGQELNRQVFETLSEEDKDLLSRRLAEFLSVLHSTPKEVIEQFNTPEADLQKDYEELVRLVEKLLYGRLSEAEVQTIKDFLAELKKAISHPVHKTLTHTDLTSEHILWDQEAKAVNIIDFGNRSVNDPAIDFAGFTEWGYDFCKKVYDLYGGEKDSDFENRFDLYFKRVAISIMIDALQGYPITFEEGYEMFKDRFKG